MGLSDSPDGAPVAVLCVNAGMPNTTADFTIPLSALGISGTGGAVVPTPSPDGKYIAFVRRVKDRTALFIKDVKTGIETPLTLELERDMQASNIRVP